MKKSEAVVVGSWHITSMEIWDVDYRDMEVPAHITKEANLTGSFQFGLVQSHLDGHLGTVYGKTRLHFSWAGSDGNDLVSGRGWMMVAGDQAEGRFFIHLGDDSGFSAVRQPEQDS